MIDTKEVYVKNFGYKRIVKNFQKFGWNVYSIVRETTTETTTKYEGRIVDDDKIEIDEIKNEKKTVWIHIKMDRNENDFVNLNKIFFLELFFNLIFLIRRLIAFFLPILSIPCIIIMALGKSDELISDGGDFYGLGEIWMLALLIWIGLIITENILASIAYKILKYR